MNAGRCKKSGMRAMKGVGCMKSHMEVFAETVCMKEGSEATAVQSKKDGAERNSLQTEFPAKRQHSELTESCSHDVIGTDAKKVVFRMK